MPVCHRTCSKRANQNYTLMRDAGIQGTGEEFSDSNPAKHYRYDIELVVSGLSNPTPLCEWGEGEGEGGGGGGRIKSN